MTTIISNTVQTNKQTTTKQKPARTRHKAFNKQSIITSTVTLQDDQAWSLRDDDLEIGGRNSTLAFARQLRPLTEEVFLGGWVGGMVLKYLQTRNLGRLTW